MKIKILLILSLLLAAVSCSKDIDEKEEPKFPPDFDWDYALDSTPLPDIIHGEKTTAKGWVEYKFVKKSELPEWLLNKTDGIANGYIIKAGSGEDLMYLLYDTEKELGQHYDAQGNPTPENTKLKDWTIIYKWDPRGLPTPLGWVQCRIVKKDDLPAWLSSMTENIASGYIILCGSNLKKKYFIYDADKETGKYYDAMGNPLEDKIDFIVAVVIYKW